MKRQRYNLTAKWTVDAPIDLTWNALIDPHLWPFWWPDIKQVKQLESPQLVAVRWRGLAGYALHVVVDTEDFKEQEFMRLKFSGDISGHGEVRLKAKNKQTTIVSFEWEVKTVPAWMNYLAKWLRKSFVYTFENGMKRAQKGINKYLAEQ